MTLLSAAAFHHVDVPETISICLGWDTKTDLDGACIIYKQEKDIYLELAKVNYEHLTALNGLIKHSGDNKKGDAIGDDEVITIQLNKLPKEVKIIAITVTSYKKVTFESIKGGFLRITDAKNNFELTYLPLSKQQQKTGLIFAFLIRNNDNNWQLVPCLRYIDAHIPSMVSNCILGIINDEKEMFALANIEQ